MSREGGYIKIDSIVKGRGTDLSNRYHRTALGNAVRFSSMLNVLDKDRLGRIDAINNPEEAPRNFIRSRSDLIDALDTNINDLVDEYNKAIDGAEDEIANSPHLTPQQALQKTEYKTRLGQTVARETAFNAAREFSTRTNPISFGTSNTAKRFFGSFTRGDDDYFGSQVLYDNVFGLYSEGYTSGSYGPAGEPLSLRDHLIENPDTDYGVTASQKVLRGIVKSSLFNVRDAIDRVDIEFGRFIGESQIDAASLTGSGLRAARSTIRRTLGEATAYQTQIQESDNFSIVKGINQVNNDSLRATEVKNALDEINVQYQNRTLAMESQDFVNKAGVASFVNLFNSAENRISIQTYQFQNDTISAALIDVVKRRVLRNMVDPSKDQKPFVLDFTVAYPRNRDSSITHINEKANVGDTGFSILGPNLIEAMKLMEVKQELQEFLIQEGIAPDAIDQYFQLNIQFRDRKYHPKLYMTDTMAMIGSQNLTGPVGNSVNQAGSNFEQMYIVRNKYTNATDAQSIRAAHQAKVQEQDANSNRTVLDKDLRSTLLYRQIEQMSNEERRYASSGREGYGILNRRGQVGLAGDIYQHLKTTIDYAYDANFKIKDGSLKGSGGKRVGNNLDVKMHLILDGSFMLQYGHITSSKQLKGEMGDDYQSNIYTREDKNANSQFNQYNRLQERLNYLLIAGQANVIVDAKNFKEQVYDPIAKKIMDLDNNHKLKQNFIKSGKNLGLLAGYGIFGPKDQVPVSTSMQAMLNFMRAQGFDKDKFSNEDLKNIMAQGSGNIVKSVAPRQHTKSYALTVNGEFQSYYLGSSNLGMYSLGIPTGVDPRTGKFIYKQEDFKSVNTEMGVMLGIGQFRRNNQIDLYETPDDLNQTSEDFSLSSDEERQELRIAGERFILTQDQLTGNKISHPGFHNIKHTPLWMDNVSQGGLNVLKRRLDTLKGDLGLDDTAFKIVERLNQEGTVASFNITIDMARVLGEKGFMTASAQLPKLNYEISVLQGPSRGYEFIDDRLPQSQTNVPGFVYFVDKNKVVGNGLFVNDSSFNISLLGRREYDDAFDAEGTGKITLERGESAHMSSLDIVPQMFATMIGEGIARAYIKQPMMAYQEAKASGRLDNIIDEYLAKSLFGIGTHIGGSSKRRTNGGDTFSVSQDITATQLLINKLDSLSAQEFVGKLSVELFGRTYDYNSHKFNADTPRDDRTVIQKIRGIMKATNAYAVDFSGDQLNLRAGEAFRNVARAFSAISSYSTREEKEQQLIEVRRELKMLLARSPELLAEVMKYGGEFNDLNRETIDFKNYMATLFDPFLSGGEERTYGGQQGFYKTILMGLSGTSYKDDITAKMMQELDPSGQDIAKVYASARIQALAYNPTTDIHELMYRSIASKSTSMPTGNSGADSFVFEQEARQMGDAANLRLMESIGIGTVIKRDAYITVDGNDTKLADPLQELLNSAADVNTALSNIRDKAAAHMARQLSNQFGNNQELLQFYTGDKITQLPQRIKNAMGARPMYQYSVEAQRILEGREYHKDYNGASSSSIDEFTSSYNSFYRSSVDRARDNAIKTVLFNSGIIASVNDTRSVAEIMSNLSSDQLSTIHEKGIDTISALNRLTNNMFMTSNYGLGAIFQGNVKSVLSQEQAEFVERKTYEIRSLYGLEEGELQRKLTDKERELAEKDTAEIIRVEILRASLSLGALGKMIAGSERTKYDMAFMQLNGSYTDTFQANPLYGTIYKASPGNPGNFYKNEFRFRGKEGAVSAGKITEEDLNLGNVLNRGVRQGALETQTRSIKGSMIGEQGADSPVGKTGMEKLIQQGDRVVEIAEGKSTDVFHGGAGTGVFAVQRKVGDKWVYVTEDGKTQNESTAPILITDEKRNVRSVGNIIDNTSLSTVGSSRVGAVTTSNYGRAGEQSIDFIYDQEFRAGNFANNEYIQSMHRLRSVLPGGGRRVEGTDSSMLLKGVANFAGDAKYRLDGKVYTMNLFQSLELQVEENMDRLGNMAGGTLQTMVEAINDNTRYKDVGLYKDMNGNLGYSPLSSMVHGLYNVNNFKSFFWSHGAKILTAKEKDHVTGASTHFLFDNLFSSRAENNVDFARRLLGGLVLAFGDEFIALDSDGNEIKDRANSQKLKEMKTGLVRAMEEGKYGEGYQFMISGLKQIKALEMRSSGENFSNFQEDLDIKVFDSLRKKSLFADVTLGSLSTITADEAAQIFNSNNSDIAEQLINKVKILAGQGKSDTGYITLGGSKGFINRQSAAIVSAIDLFQQMTTQSIGYRIPSDLNLQDPKVQRILLGVGGLGEHISKEEKEKYLAAVSEVSQQINMVSVFVENAFSVSKDPTGTQTVARHEAQHLITPYLGDIKKYQEGGQMDKIQHTIASLMALAAGSKSAMIYYDKIDMTNNHRGRALNLRDKESIAVFSPWMQKDFMGFYKSSNVEMYTQPLIKRYKELTTKLLSSDYETFIGSAEGREEIKTFLLTERYAGRMGNISEAQLESRIDDIVNRGADYYAMLQFDQIEQELKAWGSLAEQNPLKQIGASADFLNGMTNKTMFFAMPKITFSEQSGQIIARATNDDLYTFIPSAQMMKDLGAQHQDFIDPVLEAYKGISSLFAPGHLAQTAFKKVIDSVHTNGGGIILSNEEAKALQKGIEAAQNILPEVQAALASQTTQAAFYGKVKYQGFTATGIGSLLVPSDSFIAPESKMREAGLRDNEHKLELLQQLKTNTVSTSLNYRSIKRRGRIANTEFDNWQSTLLTLMYKGGDINGQTYAKSLQETFNDLAKLDTNNLLDTKGFESVSNTLAKVASIGLYVTTLSQPRKKQLSYASKVLEELDTTYSFVKRQLNQAHTKELRTQLTGLLTEIQTIRTETLKVAREELGLSRRAITVDDEGAIEYDRTRMTVGTKKDRIHHRFGVDDAFTNNGYLRLKVDPNSIYEDEGQRVVGYIYHYDELDENDLSKPPAQRIVRRNNILIAIDEDAEFNRDLVMFGVIEDTSPVKRRRWVHPTGHNSLAAPKVMEMKDSYEFLKDNTEWMGLGFIEADGNLTIDIKGLTKEGKGKEAKVAKSIATKMRAVNFMIREMSFDPDSHYFEQSGYNLITDVSQFLEKSTSKNDSTIRYKMKLRDAVNENSYTKTFSSLDEVNKFFYDGGLEGLQNLERVANHLVGVVGHRHNKWLDRLYDTDRELYEDIVSTIQLEDDDASRLKQVDKAYKEAFSNRRQKHQLIKEMQEVVENNLFVEGKINKINPNQNSRFSANTTLRNVTNAISNVKNINIETGKEWDLTKFEEKERSQIQKYYRQAIDVVYQGLEEEDYKRFSAMKKEATILNQRMAQLASLKQVGDRTNDFTAYNTTLKVLRKELGQQIVNYRKKQKEAGIKGTSSEYVYHTAELNASALMARLVLSTHEHTNLKDTTIGMLERRVELFGNIDTLINPMDMYGNNLIFSGLKASSGQLGEADFLGKMNASTQVRGLKNSEGSIAVLSALDKLQDTFDKYGDVNNKKEINSLQTRKRQLAYGELDTYIKMYKGQKEKLSELTKNRSTTPDDESVYERNIDLESEIYTKQINRIDSVIAELESLRTESSNARTRSQYKDIFLRAHDTIIAYDTSNTQLMEVFRSPTAGGTDLRLHTYRAMDGIAALNAQASMLEQIDSSVEIARYDNTRNQTALYMGAVGIVTYGGGDWDGDPYTVILNKAGDALAQVNNLRAKVREKEQTIKILKNSSNKNAEGYAKDLEEAQRDLASAKASYEASISNYKTAYTQGTYNIEARARKQVANYLGIDERYLIDATEGTKVYHADGSEEIVKGFGMKTYDADEMHALINTGAGLFDGLENSGPQMTLFRRNIDGLVGAIKSNALDEARNIKNFLANVSNALDHDSATANADPASTVAKRNNTATVIRDRARAMHDITDDAEVKEYLKYLMGEGGPGATDTELKALGVALTTAAQSVDNQRRAQSKSVDIDYMNEVEQKEYLNSINTSIASVMHNNIHANKTFNKVMGFATGDPLEGSVFDLLTKTLGKAGGEILGKTYNTIIGTTFKDAPVISLGRELENNTSALYKATQKVFIKKELVAQGRPITEQDVEAELERRNQNGGMGTHFDDYIKEMTGVMKRSEHAQGFMKNVHQILRDSIKLKGSAEKQRQELKEKSIEYESISKKLAELDPSTDNYTESKRVLQESQTNLINEMASMLGPGSGLKSLMNLDVLVKAGDEGINQKTFYDMTGIDVKSERFKQIRDHINSITPGDQITHTGDYDGKSRDLQRIAQFETMEGITSLVASYRFDNQLARAHNSGLDVAHNFALDHKRRLAADAAMDKVQGANDNTYGDLMSISATGITVDPAREAHRKRLMSGGISLDDVFQVPVNATAGGFTKESADAIANEKMRSRYFNANPDSKVSMENTLYRRALALSSGLKIEELYDDDGSLKSGGFEKLNTVAKNANMDIESYMLLFDMTYTHSLETSRQMYGEAGERIESLTNAERARVDMKTAFEAKGQSTRMGEARDSLLKVMDTEALSVMAQLATQNKLGAEGIGIFTQMLGGVMNTMLSTMEVEGGWITTDKDGNQKTVSQFSELSAQERKRYTTRAILTGLITQDPQDQGRSSSKSEALSRTGMTMEAINDDEWLDAYIKATEGTLTGGERAQIEKIAEETVLKASESDDNYGKLIDAFFPLPETDDGGKAVAQRQRHVAKMKTFVEKQRALRHVETSTNQLNARKKLLDANPMVSRSSFMGQLDSNVSQVLASNKGANMLDLLVPLGLTVVGQAIADGSYDGNDIQAMGGAAINAFTYLRPGLVDSVNAEELQKKQLVARGLSSVYKFRNALNRHDGDYGMAITDMIVREGTGMLANQMLGSSLANKIGASIGAMGSPVARSTKAIGMAQYTATQQIAGNIGSSLISAVASTLVSGVLMRTVVAPIIKTGTQLVSEFMPAADYVANVNADILARRNQEAAYEDSVNLETNDGEEEITAYNQDTSYFYGDYNHSASEDLMDMQDLDVGSDGNMQIDLLIG